MSTKAERAARRRKVAKRIRLGESYSEISEALDVSKGTIHNDVKWASVEWLKGLSEENRAIIAEESRMLYRDLVRKNRQLHQVELGVHTDEPPEDSEVIEHDLQVNDIQGEERQQWADMV